MLDFSSSTTHHADPHGRNPVHDDTTGYGGKDDSDEDTLDSFDSHHNDNKEEGVDHGYPEDSDGSGVGSDGSDGGGVEGEESDINYQESHRDGSGSGVLGDEHRRGREHVRLRELSLGGDGTDKRVEGEGEGIGYGDERYDDDDDNDEEKKEGKKRLYSRYNLQLYEGYVLDKVLGFWYFHIPVPIKVDILWHSVLCYFL